MKTKFFAAALAAMTLATAGAASAQDFRRGDRDRDWDRGDFRGRQEITIRKDGRVMTFNRGDRMFHRLQDRPFRFEPGLTYAYTDRCNRQGCVAFVFDNRHRRPIDRIFAPHLQMRDYAWREARDFDRNYGSFGRYDRDDRNWNNQDDRNYRDGRDGRFDDRRDDRNGRDRGDRLEGGPTQRR
ncbi:MAG: hypothetical protein JNL81_04530 [Hyphomonadaceae bacterium]|nr:hypothetical protein [Hyphomonadaceae bacterium]